MGVKSMTTGETIQNKRKQNGWSQDQLAEKLGISRQTISKWEQDAALPDLENGLKLCETLGISVEELLHPTQTSQTKNDMAENSFQSAEKFIKKTWHFSGLYIAFVGVLFAAAAFSFKLVTQAMNHQAQNSFEEMLGGFPGMFDGVFPGNLTSNFLDPFIGLGIGIGCLMIIIGLSLYFYGKYHKQKFN